MKSKAFRGKHHLLKKLNVRELKLCLEALPPTWQWKGRDGRPTLQLGFHLMAGYATTVVKAQGSTLPFTVLLFDSKFQWPSSLNL